MVVVVLLKLLVVGFVRNQLEYRCDMLIRALALSEPNQSRKDSVVKLLTIDLQFISDRLQLLFQSCDLNAGFLLF